MNNALIQRLLAEFRDNYDAQAKDLVWQEHSALFRRFWSERVLVQGTGVISDDECDVIIRILDRHGKGNTRESEAVARVMVPQGVWRRMLNSIHADQDLATLIDSIFKEGDLNRKAVQIDELYRVNEGKKNSLTGKSGNVVNALLAAHDPVNNLTVVSLNDRKAQLDFLEMALPFDWDNASVGSRWHRDHNRRPVESGGPPAAEFQPCRCSDQVAAAP